MSKFDRNRIKDGWEKLCTNKQTDKPTDTTKIMVTWPWTKTNHQLWSTAFKVLQLVSIRLEWLTTFQFLWQQWINLWLFTHGVEYSQRNFDSLSPLTLNWDTPSMNSVKTQDITDWIMATGNHMQATISTVTCDTIQCGFSIILQSHQSRPQRPL